MSRYEVWLAHVSTFLVGGTGLVYAWMRYLLPPVDPYAVINHPLEPATQHLHVLTAPLLVFVAGQIWYRHAWMHWRRGVRQRRTSGLAMALTLVPMVVSGYLIQTTIDETWRTAWIAVHCTASALWLAGYLAHAARDVAAVLRRRRGAATVQGEDALLGNPS